MHHTTTPAGHLGDLHTPTARSFISSRLGVSSTTSRHQPDSIYAMGTPQQRPGRPRNRNRKPKVYVGGYVTDEVADAFDAICMAQGRTRAAVVQEFVETTIAANPDLIVDQEVQEALIAS